MAIPSFEEITLQGEDANTFLQGQITVNTAHLDDTYQPTAIANLKGRIDYGIWIRKKDDQQFAIVIEKSCLSDLQAHLKKYTAFSKVTVSDPVAVYPTVVTDETNELNKTPTFSHSELRHDVWEWMRHSTATGNYWITSETQGMFQPQELRLHQRGGVHYDKGCYLGQEVIARIYFKAAPKAYLHRVIGNGQTPEAGEKLGKVKVVNAIPVDSSLSESTKFEALVVASPEQLAENKLKALDLPAALQEDVARQK